MTNVVLFTVGILFVLLALLQGWRYVSDYEVLSSYGKGYIWGNVLLLVVGILLILAGIRRHRRKKHREGDS